MAEIVSDKGSSMMVLEKITRKGDQLEITGRMMGAWPSKMYITLDEFGDFIRVMLTPSLVAYILLYPFFILRKKLQTKKSQ